MQDFIKVEKVGKFRLADKVDITDPSYSKSSKGRITTKCQPGIYTGYVEVIEDNMLGKRISRLSIYKDDTLFDMDDMYYLGKIGVDSGKAGFFRNKPDFSGDQWINFLIKAGVYDENDEYSYGKLHYSVAYGLFSSSGYGDGIYMVFANKERNAFTIMFIDDPMDEEEED